MVSTRGDPRNQIQKEVMAKAATEEKKVIVTERLMSPVKYLMLIIHIVNPNNHDAIQA